MEGNQKYGNKRARLVLKSFILLERINKSIIML